MRRREQGRADYDDLLIWARDLVRDRLEVRGWFQGRFRAVLLDEFQDTDPLQVEIAFFLARTAPARGLARGAPAPGKLFVVGDPKQSIYRFRRADIGSTRRCEGPGLAAGRRPDPPELPLGSRRDRLGEPAFDP